MREIPPNPAPKRPGATGTVCALLVSAALGSCLVVGATAATATPKATVGFSGARLAQMVKLNKRDGQYTSLNQRVAKCTSAAAARGAAAKLHKKALPVPKRVALKSLRTRNAAMANAVLRLSRAATTCATSSQATFVSTVVVPGAGGAAGSSGTSNGSAGPAPPAPGTSGGPLSLPDVLRGSSLDLSSLLGPQGLSALPPNAIVVDTADLTSAKCTSASVVCVGLDPSSLRGALTDLVAANAGAGQAIPGLDTQGLVNQALALLNSGQVSSLLTLVPAGGNLLRLVPTGPLAALAGVGTIPTRAVGTVQVS